MNFSFEHSILCKLIQDYVNLNYIVYLYNFYFLSEVPKLFFCIKFSPKIIYNKVYMSIYFIIVFLLHLDHSVRNRFLLLHLNPFHQQIKTVWDYTHKYLSRYRFCPLPHSHSSFPSLYSNFSCSRTQP